MYKLELTTLERVDLLAAVERERTRTHQYAMASRRNAIEEASAEMRKAYEKIADSYERTSAAYEALHEKLKALTPA